MHHVLTQSRSQGDRERRPLLHPRQPQRASRSSQPLLRAGGRVRAPLLPGTSLPGRLRAAPGRREFAAAGAGDPAVVPHHQPAHRHEGEQRAVRPGAQHALRRPHAALRALVRPLLRRQREPGERGAAGAGRRAEPGGRVPPAGRQRQQQRQAGLRARPLQGDPQRRAAVLRRRGLGAQAPAVGRARVVGVGGPIPDRQAGGPLPGQRLDQVHRPLRHRRGLRLAGPAARVGPVSGRQPHPLPARLDPDARRR